ncbi:uncharacterized protein [Aphelocoma coerulescens]|uniref:uncharacterized protein isoform X2 n=1 Tax=Aphelocoma coerulescens TaxID=39617 RepID=UPI0036044279
MGMLRVTHAWFGCYGAGLALLRDSFRWERWDGQPGSNPWEILETSPSLCRVWPHVAPGAGRCPGKPSGRWGADSGVTSADRAGYHLEHPPPELRDHPGDHPDHDGIPAHRLRDRPDHAHQRLHLCLRHRRDPLPGRRVVHHLRLPLHRCREEPHGMRGEGQPDHERHQCHLRAPGNRGLHRGPQPQRALPLQLQLLQLSRPGNGISIVLLIFTILEFCIAVATANFWCRATRLSSNEAMLIVPSATRVDLAVPPTELPQPPSYSELAAPEV